MPTQTDYITLLETVQAPYHIIALADDATLIVTQRGARVIGIFPSAASENLLWTNPAAFASPSNWQTFTGAGNWNLGGERIWIAPEIQYNVQDRADFWGTLRVPPTIDPAEYALVTAENSAHLSAQMTLNAYNLAHGRQTLSIQRRIAPAMNPLPPMPDVHYCGYQQQVTLQVQDLSLPTEVWNLVQVPAGGELIIPCGVNIEASDYFGSVPPDARAVHHDGVPHLRLQLDGKRQYKVGYQSRSVTGRMGYLRQTSEGHAALLVRAFFNNPSNPYAEEPPDAIGHGGHSIHVYNDGGEFGGDTSFGEMECTGTPLNVHNPLPNQTSHDTFVLWVYTGKTAAVHEVARRLLGVTL